MFELLLYPIIALTIGLVFLVWSSDVFIDGAASLSVHLNISSLIIGIVVLGFGTSLPEIIVSILAALDGSPGLAVGNVIGSNIANIALVLGVTAILAPIMIKSSILKRELPMVLGVTLIAYVLILDSYLGLVDGIILLSLLVIVMTWMIKVNKKTDNADPLTQDTEHEVDDIPEMSLKKSIVLLIVGLVVLMISAKLMVWGAVDIATAFGIPDIVIGLTIVAIGTSLPELAAAISAAKKGEADLMIGNILGSNLFNLLAVLAMPAIIAPSVMASETVSIDFPIMIALTFVMLFFALPRKGKAVIDKTKGALLLMSFVAYMLFIYLRTVTG